MALSITSGTSHLIIPKRIVLTAILIGLGTMLGMYLSEHMRAKRTESILKVKNASIKEKNDMLLAEKEEYSTMLKELEGHMSEWAEEGNIPEEFLEKHKGFHEVATSLMKQLSLVHDLLTEKEYELLDKEAMLEYQEQQLLDSEELEDRMVNYINQMAATLVKLKQPIPDGLENELFFSLTLPEPAAVEEPEPKAPVKEKSNPDKEKQIKKLKEGLKEVQEKALEEEPETEEAGQVEDGEKRLRYR